MAELRRMTAAEGWATHHEGFAAILEHDGFESTSPDQRTRRGPDIEPPVRDQVHGIAHGTIG